MFAPASCPLPSPKTKRRTLPAQTKSNQFDVFVLSLQLRGCTKVRSQPYRSLGTNPQSHAHEHPQGSKIHTGLATAFDRFSCRKRGLTMTVTNPSNDHQQTSFSPARLKEGTETRRYGSYGGCVFLEFGPGGTRLLIIGPVECEEEWYTS